MRIDQNEYDWAGAKDCLLYVGYTTGRMLFVWQQGVERKMASRSNWGTSEVRVRVRHVKSTISSRAYRWCSFGVS